MLQGSTTSSSTPSNNIQVFYNFNLGAPLQDLRRDIKSIFPASKVINNTIVLEIKKTTKRKIVKRMNVACVSSITLTRHTVNTLMLFTGLTKCKVLKTSQIMNQLAYLPSSTLTNHRTTFKFWSAQRRKSKKTHIMDPLSLGRI
jgi:hypothetical protein